MAQNNTNEYTLAAGTVLAGAAKRYVIESVLGVGGFGVTYLAHYSVSTNGVEEIRRVAIKEHYMVDYNERDTGSARVITSGTSRIKKIVDNSLKDFLAEARRLRQVGTAHPNIVKVDEVFEANGTAYYVMEYLEGTTLWNYIAGHPFDERSMLAVMMPIVNAVAYLHSQNLTHLDIKPQNIMIVGTGTATRPVLIDFGLSKHYDEHGNATSTVKTMASSDGYSPIEQYSGISKFSPTADVYALGATMMACLTGTTPTKSTEWGAGEPLRSIAMLPLSQPTALALSCAMSPMAGYRYADAGTLEAALGGAPVPPAQPTAPLPQGNSTATKVLTTDADPANNNKKSNKARIIVGVTAIAAILLMAAAAIAYIFMQHRHSEPAEPWIADTTAVVENIVLPEEENSEASPQQEHNIVVENPQVPELEIIEDEPIGEPIPEETSLAPANNDFTVGTEDLIRVEPREETVSVPVQERTYNVSMVEQRPEFPGGEATMLTYLRDNIVYPSDAEEQGIQGRVVVEFIVEKDGSIGNVSVIRQRHPALDREAVRVVQSMPRWTPGRNNGETVRVRYTLPVTFRLR